MAGAAGALWYAYPHLGWLPLLMAAFPWMLRISFGRFPFTRTPLDIFFLLFVLTALMGIWAAYDRPAAWEKFWLIVDGIFLFYALAGQPRENRWLVAGAFAAFSAAVAAYFFLTHDWVAEPSKIRILNMVGAAWMRARPQFAAHSLHPNAAGGVMAMFAPFQLALVLHGWRKSNSHLVAAGLLGFLFVLFALTFTTSRGAWIALTAGVGVWVLWGLSGLVGLFTGNTRGSLFIAFLSAVFLLGLVFVVASPGGVVGVINSLPGPSHLTSRVDLFRALVNLIGDYPITGGGLDAFPGLYSQYILVSPSFILPHGHDLYLDIALEQGMAGGVTNFMILMGGGWLIVRAIRLRLAMKTDTQLILWAALAGLLAMMIHGVADDVLYGSRAVLLMWAPLGMGVAAARFPERRVSRRGESPPEDAPPPPAAELPRTRIPWVWVGVGGLVFVLLAAAFSRPFRAAWYANLGAVQMAQIELADFPTDQWDVGRNAEALRPAIELFVQALALAPDNRTAHHRLGLAAMLFRDYNLAVSHLESARALAPQHPGIRKSLAYSYVWADRADDAVRLMAQVPEARTEMGVYVWWWRALGREDLAVKAAAMVERIDQILNNQKDSSEP